MKKVLSLVLAATLAACSGRQPTAPQTEEVIMALSITSTAFATGQSIPVIYSCKGKGISPPLAWSGAPAGTRSFAVIMDDPDAPVGTFVHWVIYNIPSGSTGLIESLPRDSKLADGTRQGTNGAGRTGYSGPCPPSGRHRYFFKLYALDSMLGLSSSAGKDQLLQAVQGHVLAQGELMGTFSQ